MPALPAVIAPAWPIRRPGGAVVPIEAKRTAVERLEAAGDGEGGGRGRQTRAGDEVDDGLEVRHVRLLNERRRLLLRVASDLACSPEARVRERLPPALSKPRKESARSLTRRYVSRYISLHLAASPRAPIMMMPSVSGSS